MIVKDFNVAGIAVIVGHVGNMSCIFHKGSKSFQLFITIQLTVHIGHLIEKIIYVVTVT